PREGRGSGSPSATRTASRPRCASWAISRTATSSYCAARTQTTSARQSPDSRPGSCRPRPPANGRCSSSITRDTQAPRGSSAAIGGSFFTHHFEVGLRGAADSDGDGQVTLAEAFRYTSVRTTSGTAATEAGPQHPTYDIRMSGRGDVVLADLRRAEATLRLP